MRVLVPLPDRDFDVTEVAVPWRVLRPGRQFSRGPGTLSARGTATDDTTAFVVQDRNYVSARWPGDAYLFGRRFCELLQPAA